MKRIIMHWTGGGHRATDLDRSHYHFIIEGDGNIVEGIHRPEANAGPLKSGRYAAHTLNGNTGSIGVAVAAMLGAQERPFRAGRYPITKAQLEALAMLCASLCRTYKIEVTRQTVLTHAEVQPTLGIAQRGKWDIAWLPGMDKPGDPVAVGDRLRDLVHEHVRPVFRPPPTTFPPTSRKTPENLPTATAPFAGLFAALAALLKSIFGGKK